MIESAWEAEAAETAALRNLADAAKMLESNPSLMQRTLDGSTGNTLILGIPPQAAPVPLKDNSVRNKETGPEASEQ